MIIRLRSFQNCENVRFKAVDENEVFISSFADGLKLHQRKFAKYVDSNEKLRTAHETLLWSKNLTKVHNFCWET